MTLEPRDEHTTGADRHPLPSTLWELATCDPVELGRSEFEVVDDRVFELRAAGP